MPFPARSASKGVPLLALRAGKSGADQSLPTRSLVRQAQQTSGQFLQARLGRSGAVRGERRQAGGEGGSFGGAFIQIKSQHIRLGQQIQVERGTGGAVGLPARAVIGGTD